jgi:hypothetical protein
MGTHSLLARSREGNLHGQLFSMSHLWPIGATGFLIQWSRCLSQSTVGVISLAKQMSRAQGKFGELKTDTGLGVFVLELTLALYSCFAFSGRCRGSAMHPCLEEDWLMHYIFDITFFACLGVDYLLLVDGCTVYVASFAGRQK